MQAYLYYYRLAFDQNGKEALKTQQYRLEKIYQRGWIPFKTTNIFDQVEKFPELESSNTASAKKAPVYGSLSQREDFIIDSAASFLAMTAGLRVNKHRI